MGEEADLVRMTAEIASARVLEHRAQPTRQASSSAAPRPRAIHQQVNVFSRMMSPSVTIGSMVRSNRATVLPTTAASPSTAPAEQVASPDESSDDAGEQNKSKVLFEFSRYEKESRSGSGRRKLMWVKYNRWVELASLTKVSAVAVDADEDSDDEDVDSPSPDARRTSPRLNKRARTVEDVEPCDVNAVEEIEVTLGPRAALSSHERDRKVPKKPEAKERIGACGKRKTPSSKISPAERCREFNTPVDQSFIVSMGKIKCAACAEVKHNKWSTLNSHVLTSKHKEKLEKWKKRANEDAAKKEDLAQYYERHPDEAMASVDGDEALYRLRVTESFLANGVPLERADGMRNLLRRSGFACTSASHLKAFIPKVELDELTLLLKELKGQSISTAFDGTTRLGEAINMVNRWCSADFQLQQRLTMFRTVEKHMDNRRLARLIGEKLLHELRVPVSQHISFHRDSAMVNGCAVERLCQLFDNSQDILCLCHTLCHVGERIELPTLASFMRPWIGLVYSHNAAKAAWKELIGSVKGYSTVRWYSRAEIEMEIAVNFGLLPKVLATFEERGYGDAHTKAMMKVYSDNTNQLELEFAAMLDQRRLVQATYDLEGDRLEILAVYDKVEALRAYGRSLGEEGTLPNTDAVLRKHTTVQVGTKISKLWPGIGMCEAHVVEVIDDLESTLMPGRVVVGYKVRYVSDCEEEDLEEAEIRKWIVVLELPQRVQLVRRLKEGYQYLENRITGACDARYSCSNQHEVFRLVRAFNPAFAVEQTIDAEYVDKLGAVHPLATEDTLNDLKSDLHNYLAAAKDAAIITTSIEAISNDVLTWWRNNGNKCPKWRDAARKIFAMSPNSASCERVFSLMSSMFTPQQRSVLADQLQASLMLKYNKRSVG
ncbi:hypothetical protein AB1Y20_012594 [Prymnesium parvum]|uniref:HAT C-terminal dimerisation domain-containing protein n=1 Tax=Prymnesium parvum TaxID=97485 RepID=A0AB34IJU3_PRYPA